MRLSGSTIISERRVKTYHFDRRSSKTLAKADVIPLNFWPLITRRYVALRFTWIIHSRRFGKLIFLNVFIEFLKAHIARNKRHSYVRRIRNDGGGTHGFIAALVWVGNGIVVNLQSSRTEILRIRIYNTLFQCGKHSDCFHGWSGLVWRRNRRKVRCSLFYFRKISYVKGRRRRACIDFPRSRVHKHRWSTRTLYLFNT